MPLEERDSRPISPPPPPNNGGDGHLPPPNPPPPTPATVDNAYKTLYALQYF